jgi:alpha-tubulin suppressor-like RCC1 family protein
VGVYTLNSYVNPIDVLDESGAGSLADCIEVAVGFDHSCAIRRTAQGGTSGTVLCWGSNQFGQLGDGLSHTSHAYYTDISPLPVAVAGVGGEGSLDDAVMLAAGAYSTCAVRVGGSVVCWGSNSFGQLGSGSTAAGFDTPRAVLDLSHVTRIASGILHACAIDSGNLYCWGDNRNAKLGDGDVVHDSCGSYDCSRAPIEIIADQSVEEIALGGSHTCAVTALRQAYCWGDNSVGQLGTGDHVRRDLPAAIAPL